MKLLFEVIILATLYKMGDFLTSMFQLPLPPVLTGMGLLLIFLATGILQPQHLERSSQFFSRHMMLFFIPVIVGIVQYAGLLKQGGWHLLFIVVISTAFVIISTALMTLIFKKRRETK